MPESGEGKTGAFHKQPSFLSSAVLVLAQAKSPLVAQVPSLLVKSDGVMSLKEDIIARCGS